MHTPRHRPRPLRALLLATLLVALAAPAAAGAAAAQESSFQDDNALIFDTTAGTTRTLDTLASLGVDRVRVSVFWATVAPDAQSRTRPDFDATDPAAYPRHAWDRYDQLVRLAGERGIAVNFNITSPAPLWATGEAPRPDLANVFTPDPAAFGRFVRAVGTRYSGTYLASTPPRTPATVRQEPAPFCATLPSACPPVTQPAPEPAPAPDAPAPPPEAPLPRVAYYSVWNEPNQGGWLAPQWAAPPGGGPLVEASPHVYRTLVDAAHEALRATGHGADTFLIGDTAPKGRVARGTTTAMTPLRFLRQLYCVDDALRPYTGPAAAVRGCPTDGDRAAFAAAHPGLFTATGFAHHPYQQTTAPALVPADPDWVTISSLPRLTRALGRLFATYGRGRAGLPLYLTEFGYATNPPNPAGVSLRVQPAYLNEAEFIAAINPQVRTLTQFLLVDDAPRPGRNGVTTGYGATSQTGLLFLDGTRKPSYTAYQLPVHVVAPTVARAGDPVHLWGLVRPAGRLGPQTVAVLFKAGGRTRTLMTLGTGTARGVLDASVPVPASGFLQLAWRDPRTGETILSRSVTVHVRPALRRQAQRRKAQRRAPAARRR